MRRLIAGIALWTSVAMAAVDGGPRSDRPVRGSVGVESVDVGLVLIEVRVEHRDGRPWVGLERDAFTVLLDHRPVDVDTFDVACGRQPGPAEDTSSGPPAVAGPGVRTVIVLDWIHAGGPHRIEMIRAARRMIAAHGEADGGVLLAIVADGVQVVRSFDDDASEASAALDRIEGDERAWGRTVPRGLTERPFFDALDRLMDVLAGYDGTKAVLLLSPWIGRADTDDLEFLELAELAADARARLYPVFSPGLAVAPAQEPFGGSAALARLANESGGRLIRATNDAAVAYRRVRDDLACVYTLGFYVEPSARTPRRFVTVRVDRPGATVRHPERLRERSPEDRIESVARAARLDPGRFSDPRVRIDARALAPRSTRAWDVVVAVDHPRPSPRPLDVPAAAVDVLVERLGGRRSALRTTVLPDTSDDRPTGVDPWIGATARLAPGTWRVIAVVQDPVDGNRPRTSTREFVVPEIPRDVPFLVGPWIGTLGEAGPDTGTTRPEDAALPTGFRPLFRSAAPPGSRVAAISRMCLVAVWPSRTSYQVVGAVVPEDDPARTIALPRRSVDLDGYRAVRCVPRLDVIDSDRLPGGGEYRVDVEIVGTDTVSSSRFRIRRGGPSDEASAIRRDTARLPN